MGVTGSGLAKLRKLWVPWVAGAILLVGGVGEGRAQSLWPQPAHDPARTGRVDGLGEIVEPAVIWSRYLGGSQLSHQERFTDLNLDGMLELLMVNGGRVLAWTATGGLFWDSGNINARRLWGSFDLDGDGVQEVLAASRTELYILHAVTGQVRYQIPMPGGAGRELMSVADIDGDGQLELLLRNDWAQPGIRCIDFSSGIENGQLLWETTNNMPAYGFELAVGDLDNNPATVEIAVDLNYGKLTILDASTGAELRHRAQPTTYGVYSYGHAEIVNVDGDAQNEFVFTGAKSNAADNGSIQITVYDYVQDAVQWHYEFGRDTLNKRLSVLYNAVSDLNGDGSVELVASVYNNTTELVTSADPSLGVDADGINEADRWVTVVYRGSDGVALAHLVNEHAVVVADLNGDGVPELVTREAQDGAMTMLPFGTIRVYEFTPANELILVADIPSAQVVTEVPEPLPGRGEYFIQDPGAVRDVDGDGVAELLILRDADNDMYADSFEALSCATSPCTVIRQLPLSNGTSVRFAHFGTGVVAGSHLALRRNDGYLDVYGTSTGMQLHHSFEVGGFSGLPIVVDTAGARHAGVQDSRGSLMLLDPATATPTTPPVVALDVPSRATQVSYALDADTDGSYEFVHLNYNTQNEPVVSLLSGGGATIWQHTFTSSPFVPTHFAWGQFGGDSTLDLAYMTYDSDGAAFVEAIDGASGVVLHSHDTAGVPSTYLNAELLTIPPTSGDSFHEAVAVHTSAGELLNGADLARIRVLSTGTRALNNVVADFDGDGEAEVFFNSQVGEKAVRELDDTLRWSISFGATHSYHEYVAGAPGVADIDAQPGYDLVIAGQFGDVSAYSGADGTVLWKTCLASGGAVTLPNNAVLTASACSGSELSSVATGDVDGDGLDELVIGGSDGHLYAINSEDGTLAWAYDLTSPVGNPTLADVDSDGLLEVLVGVSDGYLYALDQASLPKPAEVRDLEIGVDGDFVDPPVDIDQTERTDVLGASWDAVVGADGYRVALQSESGTFLIPFTDVGNTTDRIIDELSLSLGTVYYVLVQAYSAYGGASGVQISDGVTVVDSSPPGVSSLMAVPDSFNPHSGGMTTISGTLTDQTGLLGYRLEIRATPGGPILYERSVPLGRQLQVDIAQMWTGVGDDGVIQPDGVYECTVVAIDVGGHEGSDSVDVELDSVAPDPPPIITSPENEEVVDTLWPEVVGTAEPGTTVTVYLEPNDQVLCTALVTVQGGFSCVSEVMLPEGDNTIYAVSTDPASNESLPSDSVTFVVDESGPNAGGCGCSGPGPADGAPWALWLLVVVIGLLARRRWRLR